MGSSTSHAISPAQRIALSAVADATGFVRFDQFMAIALYHPTEGYYRQNRERVGRSPSTDFFTASSLGPVFGELVAACCVSLLRGQDPAAFTFWEYGAETGRSVLDRVDHPFDDVKLVGIGDNLPLTGRAVVFSNELFDAQPYRRFRRAENGWEELGAIVTTDGIEPEVRALSVAPSELPDHTPAGYHIDLPTEARALGATIAAQPWNGLFVAFDYGKSWAELTTATPQGTARAYHRHRQRTELWEAMGEQDLTCHICWDHLADALAAKGFSVDPVRSQESFLVNQAASTLAAIMSAEATRLSDRKSGLMQLLHPSALGQKFQVLSAWRGDS
jgi:SAM-dependent MidA family methyltransferase